MSHERVVIWVAAVCILVIYSLLYRENVVYRFFEHIFIGLATGFGIAVTWNEFLLPKWFNPLFQEGRWYWIFALVVGAMFYFMYSRRYIWISRLAIGTFMGLGTGAAFKGIVAMYIPQVRSSLKPLVDPAQFPYLIFNHLIVFVTLVAVMSYFFFAVEHRHRAIASSAKLGRWLLMIAFGAIFGNTVMGRMSLFIDRMHFLLFEWLKLPKG